MLNKKLNQNIKSCIINTMPKVLKNRPLTRRALYARAPKPHLPCSATTMEWNTNTTLKYIPGIISKVPASSINKCKAAVIHRKFQRISVMSIIPCMLQAS